MSYPKSCLGEGVPLDRTGGTDAGSMPLAVMQKDFLVSLYVIGKPLCITIVSSISIQWRSAANKDLNQWEFLNITGQLVTYRIHAANMLTSP